MYRKTRCVRDTDSNALFIHYGRENIMRYNILNYGFPDDVSVEKAGLKEQSTTEAVSNLHLRQPLLCLTKGSSDLG